MNFGEVLSRAWRIIWRFKVLWIFGILASCASGGGGGGGGGGGNTGFQFDRGDLPPTFPQLEALNISLIVGVIVIFGLLLTIIVLVIGTLGRIGLTRGAWQADAGAETLTFGQLWSESLPYFWRVIGLLLLVFLVGLVFFFIAAIPFIGGIIALFAAQDSAVGPGLFLAGLPVFLCLICLFVPISWAISLIVQQAIVAIVNEDVGIREGISRGWEVVLISPGNIIVMAIILYGARWVLSLILSLPFLAVLVPIVAGYLIDPELGLGIGFGAAVLILLVLLPIMIVLGGIIETYVGTAWTLTFRRLTGRTAAGTSPAVTPEAPSA